MCDYNSQWQLYCSDSYCTKDCVKQGVIFNVNTCNFGMVFIFAMFIYFILLFFIDTGANGFNGSGYLKCQGMQKPSDTSNMGSKLASTAIIAVVIVGNVVVFG